MSNAFEKHHGNSYWNLKWNAILRVIRENRIYSSLKKTENEGKIKEV